LNSRGGCLQNRNGYSGGTSCGASNGKKGDQKTRTQTIGWMSCFWGLSRGSVIGATVVVVVVAVACVVVVDLVVAAAVVVAVVGVVTAVVGLASAVAVVVAAVAC
jgi:hypothetical protein